MTAQTLLSTQEVAVLLNAAETTIKRWADEQTLNCVKTPGGHRRFVMSEVLAFSEQHGYPLTGLIPPPMTHRQRVQIQTGVQTREFSVLAEVFLEEALEGDRNGLFELLTYVYTHQIPITVIADELIRPAMKEVGVRWSRGVLEVNQEHRASQAVLEALLRFGSTMHHKARNGLTAVCSCVEGELHSIGLQCVAYGLEGEGWNVHMLGANTPFDALRSHVKLVRPNLLCLSSTVDRRRKELSEAVRSLAELVHTWDGVVVLGGHAAGYLTSVDLGKDCVARSLHEALTFTRDHFQLKPGPKKQRPSRPRPLLTKL
jgi:excisionase family DNA binding protein